LYSVLILRKDKHLQSIFDVMVCTQLVHRFCQRVRQGSQSKVRDLTKRDVNRIVQDVHTREKITYNLLFWQKVLWC